MKKILFLFVFTIFTLIGCGTKAIFVSGSTDDLSIVFDSIEKADEILIPDTSLWMKSHYMTNLGPYVEKTLIINGVGKQYILTISGDSSKIKYRYRVE